MTEDPDPSAIRSLAVAADDVASAFEYTRTNPGAAVLRVTPPFHGRMRARLHVYRDDDARETGAIHVDPAALLEDEVVESYPSLEGIESRLEAEESGEVSTERVRETYERERERWRERAETGVVDEVVLETPGGSSRVDVKPLDRG